MCQSNERVTLVLQVGDGLLDGWDVEVLRCGLVTDDGMEQTPSVSVAIGFLTATRNNNGCSEKMIILKDLVGPAIIENVLANVRWLGAARAQATQQLTASEGVDQDAFHFEITNAQMPHVTKHIIGYFSKKIFASMPL